MTTDSLIDKWGLLDHTVNGLWCVSTEQRIIAYFERKEDAIFAIYRRQHQADLVARLEALKFKKRGNGYTPLWNEATLRKAIAIVRGSE